jgi:hypothetical protein
MIKNVGGFDRVFRIVAGLFLLSMLFWLEGNGKYFGLIGIVPLATALMNNCPLYSVLKISTCKTKAK